LWCIAVEKKIEKKLREKRKLKLVLRKLVGKNKKNKGWRGHDRAYLKQCNSPKN